MRRTISILSILLSLGACNSEQPRLTYAEARLHLARFYIAAADGQLLQGRVPSFALERDGRDVRHAVDADGERLASFRWSGHGWTMTPDPFLKQRLSQLARDRPLVIDLTARVDSAETAVSEFEATLVQMVASDRGSDPWAWRLEQARDYLFDMEGYIKRLRDRAGRLAGAAEARPRIDALLERVRGSKARIEAELAGRRTRAKS